MLPKGDTPMKTARILMLTGLVATLTLGAFAAYAAIPPAPQAKMLYKQTVVWRNVEVQPIPSDPFKLKTKVTERPSVLAPDFRSEAPSRLDRTK